MAADIIQSIKDRILISDLAQEFGVQLKPENNELKGCCPFHGDRDPSFTIYTGDDGREHFKCFGCKIGGDVIDFYQKIRNVDLGTARRDLAVRVGLDTTGRSPDPPRPRRTDADVARTTSAQSGAPAPAPPDSPLPAGMTAVSLADGELERQVAALERSPDVVAFLQDERRLSPDIIRRARLGYDVTKQRVVIPLMNAGGSVIRTRLYDWQHKYPGRKMLWGPGEEKPRLYPAWALQEQELLLCAGEMDALAAWSIGIPAITGTGGEGKWGKDFNEPFAGKTVTVCYDVDTEGQEHAPQVAQQLAKVAAEVRVLALPLEWKQKGDPKDVTDWILAGGTADQLRELIKAAPVMEKPPAPAEADSTPERRPRKGDLVVHEGTYCRVYQSDPDDPIRYEPLSNFVLEPIDRLMMPAGDELLHCRMVTDKTRASPQEVILPNKAFNSRRDFLSALSLDAWWTGSDRDVQILKGLLMQEELLARRGTSVMGLHDGMYVLPSGTLTPDGWDSAAQVRYVRSRIEFERYLSFPQCDNWTDLAQVILELLPRLNSLEIMVPLIGWFFASPLAPKFRAKDVLGDQFPILQLWGNKGAGKTSLAVQLWRLLGITSRPYSATETEFSFIRLLSCTNALPVLIDEYKPHDMQDHQVKFLHRILRKLYGGEMEQRGRSDQSVDGYVLQAPAVLVGEQAVQEAALLERFLIVRVFGRERRPKGAADMYRAFRQLPLAEFAGEFLRRALEIPFKETMQGATASLEACLKQQGLNLADRIFDNLSVVATGWEIFQVIREAVGLPRFTFENCGTDLSIIYRDLVNAVTNGGRSRDATDILLEELTTLAHLEEIRHGTHYSRQDLLGELWIHLESCLEAYSAHLRRTGKVSENLSVSTYRKLFEERMLPAGYVKSVGTRQYINKSQRVRCVVIDQARLQELLDIDPTSWPRPEGGY